MRYGDDQRVVLTLDAGGTNFVFTAIQGNRPIVTPVTLPAETRELPRSLDTMDRGFRQVLASLDTAPVAISFAFPGPADYPNGIVDNHNNLPAFAGGVPLGPWLERRFELPVFINNDGDLFTYGEAIAGLLPKVSRLLAEAGSPKRYRTLLGITLGTGFGGGLVHHDRLFMGDNSNATEIWLLRNKVRPECLAEDGASIRAVRNAYALALGLAPAAAPPPKEIAAIARGEAAGDRAAARAAFHELGVVVGDALANAITLLDGLVVIGGGLAAAHSLFMPAVLSEMNGRIASYNGSSHERIVQRVYDLDADNDLAAFLQGETKQIALPGSSDTVAYDPLKRVGLGVSVLGTSEAVSIGAYAFALNQLDQGRAQETNSKG